MNKIIGKLTVFFDEPYWVGVYERQSKGKLEVSKVIFGPEPKDYEIYDYFVNHYNELLFSPPVGIFGEKDKKINPKRMQRAINRQLSQNGIGTKAQQALKLQQEQSKLQRKIYRRQKSEEEKQRQFELKQEKKKEKHKGR